MPRVSQNRPPSGSNITIDEVDFDATYYLLREHNVTVERLLRIHSLTASERESIFRQLLDWTRPRNIELPRLADRVPNAHNVVVMTFSHSSDENNGSTCSRCNEEFCTGETVIYVGNRYAFHPGCYSYYAINHLPVHHGHGHEADLSICPLCGNPVRGGGSEHVHLGIATIHAHCFRTSSSRCICENCGSVGFSGFRRDRNGHTYCPSCMDNIPVECFHCRTTGTVSGGFVEISTGRSPGYLCPTCRPMFTNCQRCGMMFNVNGVTGGLCARCAVAGSPKKRVHPYRFKPKVWRQHGKSHVQYGLELETDGYGSRDNGLLGTKLLYDTEKGETSFFLKEDGSLRDHGFELVFHPRELASWYSYAGKLGKITEAVTKAGGKSYNTTTCGIHVHRGVKDISGYHIVKMNYMLAKFRRLTRQAALRRPNDYCREADLFDFNDERTPNPKKIRELYKLTKLTPYQKTYSVDRYLQLNFQNEHTIELRIFKGNLKVTTIISSIMFFDRLVEFTRKQTIREMDQMTEDDVIKLFNGFCKTWTTKSTLGKRKNNAFAKVSDEATEALINRIGRHIPGSDE